MCIFLLRQPLLLVSLFSCNVLIQEDQMGGTRCTNDRKKNKLIQGFGWKARKKEPAANKTGGRHQNGF